MWWSLPAWAAAAYYLLAIWAAIRWKRMAQPAKTGPPAISVLKPVHGRDPQFYEAIASHARQDHPQFEILFGVSDPEDAALKDIHRLQHEFPAVPITVHVAITDAPNAKAGVLAELACHARHPLLLVNDGDIRVEPDYLRSVEAPLADPGIGLVTCLYRARGHSPAARAEALGIATEFAPSVLVARLLGVAEFALGSTMVFRADDLRAIGGFEAIADYLADDYQLGLRIHQLGRRIELSRVVVETDLGGGSWRDVWLHQLRWSRTIRVSRPSGYFGYVVTHATLWSVVAIAAGYWPAALAALGVRMIAGMLVGGGVLRDVRVWRDFWMIPLRDLFGFAVWLGGVFGNAVEWRGQRLKLRRDGRISNGQDGAQGEAPLVEDVSDKFAPPALTPEELDIEQRALDRVQSDLLTLVQQYRNTFGNEISTDNAREIVSPEYAASREGRTQWSNATLRPASSLAGHLFRDLLSHPDPVKPRQIVMTAGGPGAGKTSSLKALPGLERVQLVYDGNLSDPVASVRSIEAAKSAGNRVEVVYVRRDPVDALAHGVLPRAMDERNGRIVTLEAHVRLHCNAAKNLRYLRARYVRDPLVHFIALDNNGPRGQAHPIPVEEAAQEGYTKEELLPRLREALEQEYVNGRISEAVYRATLGSFAPGAMGGSRGDSGL